MASSINVFPSPVRSFMAFMAEFMFLIMIGPTLAQASLNSMNSLLKWDLLFLT
jgi:hypothetical protein